MARRKSPRSSPALFPNLLANGASGIAVGMATSIPPHNVGELIDAAIRLIERKRLDDSELMETVKGPDFPTGGILVDDRETILRAYVSGRGSFRLRAKIDVEREKGGGWTLLVSEIPYGVQKSKLIEQIAALIADKKLPILADVRDESDEQVRLILEPRARTVDPDLLIESLCRLTDLEIRFPLNLNVLDENRTPGVMSLKEALVAWLKFQREVLVRKSQVRIGKIDERLELLDGFLIAFLNLDRVIAIIRTEDEPKPVMIEEFALSRAAGRSDPQHAPAEPAQARGNGDRPRALGSGRRARGASAAGRGRSQAVAPAEVGPEGRQGRSSATSAAPSSRRSRRRARSTGRR